MSKSDDEKYFVKFYLVPDEEEGMNIEIQTGLPNDRDTAMAYMSMLSQINTGECSNLILDNIHIESHLQRNIIFQEISKNWKKELEERLAQAAHTSHGVVSPLRVFGGSNL